MDRARLRGDAAHGGQHEDVAVLRLHLAAAREVSGLANRREASQVPDANRSLHTLLVVEGSER